MHSELLVTWLLWFGAMGCGMIAGLYFAFSTFVMRALGRIEQAQGISAMNSINSDDSGFLVHAALLGNHVGQPHSFCDRIRTKRRAGRDGDACGRTDLYRGHVLVHDLV
jgi:hypothetical protein